MKHKFISVLALVAASLINVSAQTALTLPDASQQAMVKQRVGVTDITITYARPLVNARKVWGGLVPMGEVWRAGANANTTIEFSTAVQIEGKPLAAGKYGLHTIPKADSWTIIFSKMAAAWGSYTYDEKEDALRVEVKTREGPMEEALEFEFDELKSDSVVVLLKWEKLVVPFRVAATDADAVIPHIRNELRGHAAYEWQKLYEAAQYCLTKKINLEEALKWAEQSIRLEERFENLMAKSEILKALNKGDEAKAAATQALEKASVMQLYGSARRMQSEKRDAEAMEMFQMVAKRFPQHVFGHLSQARIKSAAGDFVGAAESAKQAQAVALSEEQKKTLQGLIEKLNAKQDINK
jgi:tetratricopeptide (TPR) repeat protein